MTDCEKPKVVVISGPTASGKTSLGIRLALALEGEIINADSMQVYRWMDVGTAKPTLWERKGVPHYLLDVVDPDEEFNAAIFRSIALPRVEDIVFRGKTCFVVGGTGLYMKSLLGGLLSCPPSDAELRQDLLRECRALGSVTLHERLERLDPDSAHKIHPNDRMRVVRALEIIRLTGRLPSELRREHDFKDSPVDALFLCLKVDRKDLYDGIEVRSKAMMERGLAEETERLLEMGYSPDLKPMNSIGYRHMIKHLKGVWSFDEAFDNLLKDTRRYAKRQMTWFRADRDVTWIEPGAFHQVLARVKHFMAGTT